MKLKPSAFACGLRVFLYRNVLAAWGCAFPIVSQSLKDVVGMAQVLQSLRTSANSSGPLSEAEMDRHSLKVNAFLDY